MIVKTTENKSFPNNSSRTVLEDALNSGIVFEHSCKTGQCGVCKTSLLEGSIKEVKPQLALSDEEIAEGMFLTCCCAADTDILIDAVDLSALHGIETKIFPARISELNFHTNNILEVSLRLPPNTDFRFLEGQYVDVINAGIKRSYSIFSSSDENVIRLLIKRVLEGEMSQYWFDEAKINDLLRIEGPKGTFFIRDASTPLLFLATGTGIAPVLSMLSKLDNDPGFEQTQSIALFWGNRSLDEFVIAPSFKKLNVSIYYVLSRSSEGWKGDVGYVQDIVLSKVSNLKESSVYLCGSEKMIHDARLVLVNAGISHSNIFYDAFVKS